MFYKSYYFSPIGKMLLVSDGESLCALRIEGQKYFDVNPDRMPKNDKLEIFCNTKRWLERYFDGQNPDLNTLPLSPQGTEFQKAVWKVLCNIPYGKVVTYGDIARKINRNTRCAQAIGGAVARNPILVIIPCHRVIGADKSLTGYAAGVDKKLQLLKLENAGGANTFTTKT